MLSLRVWSLGSVVLEGVMSLRWGVVLGSVILRGGGVVLGSAVLRAVWTPPPREPEKRALRILLECFLVTRLFSQFDHLLQSYKSKRYRDKLRSEIKALEDLLPVDRTSVHRKLDSQTVFRLVIAFFRTKLFLKGKQYSQAYNEQNDAQQSLATAELFRSNFR